MATASAACEYLRARGEARRAGSRDPFCLTVGFLLPHPPYVAWSEDYERFAGRVPPPVYHEPPSPPHAWEQWWRENRNITQVDAAAVQRARTAYYGLVHRLDVMVGEVLRCLEGEGLDENTLIVYSTDHGDQLGERGLWWKHTLYEDSVRVPLVLRWPKRVPAGERRAQVVDLLDVAATMAGALGGPALPYGHGRDLLPVAEDPKAPWVDEIFCEHCTDTVPAWTGGQATQQRMVRSGDWKLIYAHGYPVQLYDLARDPHERHDLGNDPQHAPIRARLEARVLDGWNPGRVAAASASAGARRTSSMRGRATCIRAMTSGGSSCLKTIASTRCQIEAAARKLAATGTWLCDARHAGAGACRRRCGIRDRCRGRTRHPFLRCGAAVRRWRSGRAARPRAGAAAAR